MSSKPLFVLICDRSPGYFQMTIQAIRCLRKHTKNVPIGIIFPAGGNEKLADNKNAVLTSLKQIDPSLDQKNIFFKEGTNHFENWNPTQHKLDIELFAKEFDPIVWLDSDTVVLKNLEPFINTFQNSGKKFAFLADHVNNDPNFKKNWEGPLFVPQACYMIFRSAYIPEFFKIWEDTWKEWITPYPFQRHKDPAPHFNNSFFCIEQYALGQALFKYVKESEFDAQVLRIDRNQLFIGRNIAADTQKIKQDFQSKSASRPSALAHVPHQDKEGNKTKTLLEIASPKSIPRSPQAVPSDGDSFPTGSEAPTTTTYAPEATTGDEGGFIVTATYTTAPGVFLADGSVSTSSSSSFPAGEGENQALISVPSTNATSYTPSSYVSSYSVPSSYPTSYTRPTSYTAVTSYTAGVTTSYQASASAATSYAASASAATSYAASASAATSYAASAAAATSYTGATSYASASASSYASSYPTSGSYGYVSSLSSSAGLSTLYTEDGGLPLTNYGNLSLQFSLPGEEATADTASSSMYVYGALDSNVYFLTTNAALASSSQATNLSNSNNEFYMVDLIQDNSIAHYYNANQGVNSSFVADHGTVVAETITQINAKVKAAGPNAKAPTPQAAVAAPTTGKKSGKK